MERHIPEVAPRLPVPALAFEAPAGRRGAVAGPELPLTPEVRGLVARSAGLRRGEVTRLTVGDYDAHAQTLLIRASKFHKSRCLPLAPDAGHEVEVRPGRPSSDPARRPRPARPGPPR